MEILNGNPVSYLRATVQIPLVEVPKRIVTAGLCGQETREMTFGALLGAVKISRDILDSMIVREHEPMYPFKMPCISISGRRGGKGKGGGERLLAIDPTLDTCQGCVRRPLSCSMASACGFGYDVYLPMEETEKQLLSSNVNLARLELRLGRAKFDNLQYNLPSITPREICADSASIYEFVAAHYLNADIWHKIVRFHFLYDDFSPKVETLNKVSPNDRLNCIRLMMEGVDQSFILDPKRRHRIRTRFVESLQYALSVEQFGEMIERYPELSKYQNQAVEFIELMTGLDKLRVALDDPEVHQAGQAFPHVYDLLRYIANGNSIKSIASLMNLSYEEYAIENYSRDIGRFLRGEVGQVGNAHFVGMYRVSSSLALLYFLTGNEYKSSVGGVDGKILKLARRLFQDRDLGAVMGSRFAPESDFTHNRMQLLRRFFMSVFELDNSNKASVQDDNFEATRVYLEELKELPEIVIDLLARPQGNHPQSKFGLRQVIRNVSDDPLQVESVRMYRNAEYLTQVVNGFLSTLLNVVTGRFEKLDSMSEEDWIRICQSHRDKCEQFVKLVYAKIHPSVDGIAS